MTNTNPATPANAATPGNVPAVVIPASGTTPAPTGDQGSSSGDGKVTIDLKEYRDLQRAKARTLSFEKRAQFKKGNAGQGTNPENEGDPELVEKLNQEASARQAAERRALQAEVRGNVRELLEKDEFKTLPKSTKELILKNPGMLSSADTLEEAMLDIEDFVRDQVLVLDVAPTAIAPKPAQPAGHDAPPAHGGAPAQSGAVGLEDTSKLTGSLRSAAMIRNTIKKSKGVK